MKIKRFSLVVVIIVAGLGLWWFMRPSSAAPEKVAEGPTPTKVTAPKPLASSQVVQPLAQPAQTKTAIVNSPSKSAKAAPDSSDPQADLQTAIPDIVRLAQAGEVVALLQTYMPPGKLTPAMLQRAQATKDQKQALADQVNKLQLSPNSSPAALAMQRDTQSKINNLIEQSAHAYDSLSSQTPTLNATGDEATYLVPNPFSSDPTPAPMVMVKLNGKWYIKRGLYY